MESKDNIGGIESPTIELEHAIGYSGLPNGLHYHPNSKDFVYAAGGCVVMTALDDPHDQSFLRGHTESISSIVMSPSGQYLASSEAGQSSDVLVWEYESQNLLFRCSEHDYGIAATGFSHDDKLLATIGDPRDNKLFIWDMSNGAIVTTDQKLSFEATALAWGGMHRNIKRRDTDSYLFATVGKKSMLFWVLNPVTGELVSHKAELQGLVRDYTCLAFSPDRESLVAGTTSGDVIVVSVKGYRMASHIQACSGGVHSLAVYEYGTFVGGGDGSVVFYDTNQVDKAMVKLQGPVTGLSIRPDGRELIGGTSRGFVYRMTLDAAAGAIRALLQCENHAGSVVAVDYDCTSSDRFATISNDGIIRVWDASDYSVIISADVAVSASVTPSSLCYTTDLLISGWSDGTVRCYRSDSGDFLWSIDNAHVGGVTSVVVSSNLRFIVTGGTGGDVRVWGLRKRDLISHLKEHTMCVTDLAMFDDDIHVLSCSRDRSFLCWDLKQERRVSSHTQRMGGINAIALSRDQATVLTVGQEKKVSSWDLRMASPIRTIDADEATCVAVGNRSDLVATGGTDAVVKLYDNITGNLLADGIGHSGTIRSVKFSPDDRQVVTVGEDGNIFVWNVYT